MKLSKIIIATLLVTLSGISNAVEQGYIGASFSKIYYQESDVLVPNGSPISVPDAKFSSLNLLGGLSISDKLSSELRFGFGLDADTLNLLDNKIDLDQKWYVGGYVKYAGTTINGFTPYGLIGYTRGRIDAKNESLDDVVSVYESDLSFGLGVEYLSNSDNSFNLEFINLLDTGNVTINAFTIGFKDFF